MSQTKPLAHLKIIDFSAVYAGPICTRLMSDCGADVVKIETPGLGDVIRGPKGTSRVFSHFNAGKKSVAIDLKTAEGQAMAKALVADADVVVENFRPGVMKQFGLDYASLSDVKPDLVYCSISGFGQNGPFAQRAAYAPIAHAAGGFDITHMRSQGEKEVEPSIWGIMIADMLTGSYAYGAIQTALLGRQQTGKGEHIDVTMLESMISLIPGQVQGAQIENAPTGGGFHPVRTSDGHLMICILSGKNMQGLCKAIDRQDMFEDERFSSSQRFRHMKEFVAEIERWSLNLSALECERVLNEFGVPCSVYNAAEDLFDHPQVLSRNVFTEQHDEYGMFKIQNAPYMFASVDISTSSESPALGEHTDHVLSQYLGYSSDRISSLRSSKVVA